MDEIKKIKANIILNTQDSLGLCDTDIDRLANYILSERQRAQKEEIKFLINLIDNKQDRRDDVLYKLGKRLKQLNNTN